MLLLGLELSLAVTGNACNRTLNSTGGTVCDTRAEVVELTLGFLGFAFGVLLGTCTLEILWLNISALVTRREKARKGGPYLRTDKSTQSLLGRANGLIPGALSAIGVILCDSTR
jgi:hypothetical protein